MKILFPFLLFLTLLVYSCKPAGKHITHEMYGDAWPFTVEDGYLECRNYAVLFHHGGKTYLLHGEPNQIRQEMADEPLHDLTEIWLHQDSSKTGWAPNIPLDTLISGCPALVTPHEDGS